MGLPTDFPALVSDDDAFTTIKVVPYRSDVRKIFKGLEASEIQHPEDRVTIAALQRIPGVEAITSKLEELAFQRIGRLELIASNIQVTERQYKLLHTMVRQAATILSMPTPELYITNSPQVNAGSTGLETPVIVLDAGLIDVMSEAELQFVLAHELGHIKCGHTRYMTMIDLLCSAAEFSIMFDLVLSRPIALALKRWQRRSELSADRAGLIGCQNTDVALGALMKLAGASILNRFGSPDVNEFLRQSDRYHRMTAAGLNRAYSWVVNTEGDHPQPVARAKELMDWAASAEFHALVAARAHDPVD